MPDILPFIQNHLYLTSALIGILIALVIVELYRKAQVTNRLNTTQVTNLVNHDDAVVLDIRSQEAFDGGHIVGAISMPWVELKEKPTKLNKYQQQPIVVVCAQGMESTQALPFLQKQGCTKVYMLAGGIRAWQQAGIPLVKG